MKKTFALLLILFLFASFAGCRAIHQAEEYIDHKLDAAENQVEQAIQDAVTPVPQQQDPTIAVDGITEAEVQAIVLDHAGLTEQDISHLHIRTDWDDGRQEYEVEFHAGHLEYEYEIDFLTGKILSFDKDH